MKWTFRATWSFCEGLLGCLLGCLLGRPRPNKRYSLQQETSKYVQYNSDRRINNNLINMHAYIHQDKNRLTFRLELRAELKVHSGVSGVLPVMGCHRILDWVPSPSPSPGPSPRPSPPRLRSPLPARRPLVPQTPWTLPGRRSPQTDRF